MATYSVTLSSKFITNVDEIYKNGALTIDLEGNGLDIREGADAHEIKVPKFSLGGLEAYTRGSDYTDANVSFSYETVTLNYERGTRLKVDRLDNSESGEVAFGKLAANFEKAAVIPEKDAFVFHTICQTASVGAVTTAATLSTGAEVIAAIRAGVDALDTAEANPEGRILYITPALLGLVNDLDTTKSREVLAGFEKIVKVPQGRFYTKISLGSGFSKDASNGKDLNFVIVQKDAIIDYTKHYVGQVMNPDQNPTGDYYALKFRVGAFVKVLENKVGGIYYHNKA